MNPNICEWDQFVILDPEDPIIKKNNKKRNNSSKPGYKYSDINPLESLYEEDDEDDEDDKYDEDDDKKTIHFKSFKLQNVSVVKCIYWGEILVKSMFTGCMIYAFFIF
jgi:hypothetical protein